MTAPRADVAAQWGSLPLPTLQALGDVDELNSCLGIARAFIPDSEESLREQVVKATHVHTKNRTQTCLHASYLVRYFFVSPCTHCDNGHRPANCLSRYMHTSVPQQADTRYSSTRHNGLPMNHAQKTSYTPIYESYACCKQIVLSTCSYAMDESAGPLVTDEVPRKATQLGSNGAPELWG